MEKNKDLNVPPLRFDDERWNALLFSDYFEISNGINKDKNSFGHGNPIVNYMDVNKHAFLTPSLIKGMVDSSPLEIKRYGVTKNDILITRTSETKDEIAFSSCLSEVVNNCVYSGFLLRARPKKDGINPLFIVYMFRSTLYRKKLMSISTETSRALINGNNLGNLKFHLPSAIIQSKISVLFFAIDQLIETQKKIIEGLKTLKQWYIQKLFCDRGLYCEGRELRLSELLKCGSKIPVDTQKYKKITIKLNMNGIDHFNGTREMSDTRPFYVRKKGEIIIGKQNYFNGSIAMINEEFNNTICSNAIMSFSVKSSVNTQFLFIAISNKQFLKCRAYYANGTGQKELSESDFLNFTIRVPSTSEQMLFSYRLNLISNQIEIESIIENELLNLRVFLLKNMFI